MIFIGLLTHQQKQAGFFMAQDEDYIYLMRGNNGAAKCVGMFLYQNATVREIRERAEVARLKL